MNRQDASVHIPKIRLRPDGLAPAGSLRTAGTLDYDEYFRIERGDVSDAQWWAGAHRIARAVLDELAITDLAEDLRTQLLSGISTLLLARGTEPAPTPVASTQLHEDQSAHAVAMRRWKLGHHLFHYLLSLMNSRSEAILRAARGRDWPRAEVIVHELTLLYDAATAAMHFAADFPASLYESTVRPSMEPPWMPAGFSGVFNSDHAELMNRLGDIKAVFREARDQAVLPDGPKAAATALWKAQSRNRRDHKLICAKFVPDGESLLQQYFDENSGED